jgi:general secretion pathway protein G
MTTQTPSLPNPSSLARPISRRRRSRGMTLIEILVVLAIIGLIVGGVSVVAFNAFGESKIKQGYNDVINVQKACEQYMLQKNDKCPKSLQDLKAAGVVSRVQKDPWGEDFIITCPGEHGNAVDVQSYGPDKKQGGGDDIVSWESPQEKDDKKNAGK